ncbi:AAA family ATPase, partial [filamentous cyanobacterium CCP2]
TLRPDGVIVLAETIARQTQRLYGLIDPKHISPKLYKKWVKAEEAIYHDSTNPMVNWDAKDIALLFEKHHLHPQFQIDSIQTELQITVSLLDRWFTPNPDRPSYIDQISHHLSESELETIRDVFYRFLKNQSVNWAGTIGFYQATHS